ncbi:MAG: LptF/LptG family permease [Candidatus Aminicenantes bacterium]|nr:LptF/LptG family permease [Candidatus Aminicenantes bacterium]
MKIITRYIIREIFSPSLLGMLVFTFIILMNQLLLLANMFIQRGVSLANVMRFLVYMLPSIVVLTLPMATLLGTMIALSRLSSDSEIIAYRSAGISIYKLLVPVLIFCAAAWILDTYLMTEALPWGNRSTNELQFKIMSARTISGEIKPRIFEENFPHHVLYVSDMDKKGETWKKVFLCETREIGKPRVVFANQGRPIYDPKMKKIGIQLVEGALYEPPTSSQTPRMNSFQEMQMILFEEKDFINTQFQGITDERAMTPAELWEQIQKRKGRNELSMLVENHGDLEQRILIELKVATAGVGMFWQGRTEHRIQPQDKVAVRVPYYLPFSLEKVHLGISIFRLPPEEGASEGKPLFKRVYSLPNILKIKDISDNDTILQKKIKGSDFLVFTDLKMEKASLPQNYNSLMVELHKKFSIPFACLIFGILGLPLGIRLSRGGKSLCYIIGLIIFIVYWLFLINGEALGDRGDIPPFLGMWAANILFGALGIFLLFRRGKEADIHILTKAGIWLKERFSNSILRPSRPTVKVRLWSKSKGRKLRYGGFPPIIDRYILITFGKMFLLVAFAVYSVLALTDFIDISEEMHRNNVSYLKLVDFYKFKLPEVLSYILPVATLMAAMVTFGLLSKNNEIHAFKAGGISLYRLSAPILIMAIIISGLGFGIYETVLPYSSRRLGTVLEEIRGGPTQTHRQYLGQRWVIGKEGRIYFYALLDVDNNIINQFSFFDYDPESFRLTRRIYAEQARWDEQKKLWFLNNGWVQDFSKPAPTITFFGSNQMMELAEDISYFRQEVTLPEQMSYRELKLYIKEIKRRGYDVTKYEVDLHWKLSFPLITLIVVLIGIPFSFRVGRKGALSGIFVSLGLVIVYWGFVSLFKSLGGVGVVSPFLGAWAPNFIFGIGGIYMMSTMRT